MDEWREYVDTDGTGEYDDDTADLIAEALLAVHVHEFNRIVESRLIRWDIDRGRITEIEPGARNDVDDSELERAMYRAEDTVVSRYDQIEQSAVGRGNDEDREPVHGAHRH